MRDNANRQQTERVSRVILNADSINGKLLGAKPGLKPMCAKGAESDGQKAIRGAQQEKQPAHSSTAPAKPISMVEHRSRLSRSIGASHGLRHSEGTAQVAGIVASGLVVRVEFVDLLGQVGSDLRAMAVDADTE